MTPTPPSPASLVTGEHGLRGTLESPTPGGSTPTSVGIRLSDGRRVVVPAGLLKRRSDGTYHLPLGPADLAATTAGDAAVIPLVAEQVDVHKRRVETGKVRITKSVRTHEEQVEVPVMREEVVVERVPIERFVAAPPPVRQEGDVTIVSVLEEVLVVEKRLMVREELRLTKRQVLTHDTHTVTLRSEVANVERVAPDSR